MCICHQPGGSRGILHFVTSEGIKDHRGLDKLYAKASTLQSRNVGAHLIARFWRFLGQL